MKQSICYEIRFHCIAGGMCVDSVRRSFCACVVAAIFVTVSPTGFHYEDTHKFHRVPSCRVCDEAVCWPMPAAQCQYYMKVDVAAEDEPGDSTPVDGMLYDMMAEAEPQSVNDECIPFVSQYTDCHIENICTGCSVCSCDGGGRWRCAEETRCHQEDVLIDKKVISTVLDNLIQEDKERVRRSTVGETRDYEELPDWMLATPFEQKTDTTTKPTDYLDYLDFNDVLKTIGLNKTMSKRRKSHFQDKNNLQYDYMDTEFENITMPTKLTPKDSMFNKDYFIEALTDKPDDAKMTTKIIIDLFDIGNQDDSIDYNMDNDVINEKNDVNETVMTDTSNIMKRDVKDSSNVEITTGLTTTTAKEDKENIIDVRGLEANVLNPLNNIIRDKQIELTDLLKIKEHLYTFIQTWHKTNNVTASFLNSSSPIYALYNVDVKPEIEFDLRKINENNVGKLLYKMKRDIVEVIKDITSYQQVTDKKNIPEDLKVLITAMKYYIREKKHKNTDDLPSNWPDRQPQRNSTVKVRLIQMLKYLELNSTTEDVLKNVSIKPKKIIKRLVKSYYTDDTKGKESNLDLDVSNSLKDIGKDWGRLVERFQKSDAADRYYSLKLLHAVVSEDIAKLTDIIKAVSFLPNRRMLPSEEKLTNEISSAINEINKNVQELIHYKKETGVLNTEVPVEKKKKKSLFRKLKNLLRQSKKEIRNLVDQGVTKDEIVKKLVKKSYNDNNQNDFKNTMLKWQNDLHIVKRSTHFMDKFKNRMKNIIPKYLRGKVQNYSTSVKNNKRNTDR